MLLPPESCRWCCEPEEGAADDEEDEFPPASCHSSVSNRDAATKPPSTATVSLFGLRDEERDACWDDDEDDEGVLAARDR